MRLKSIQEQLDHFIYKRNDNRQSLKEKAIKKSRQLLNPEFLLETFKERQEKKMRAKESLPLNNSIDENANTNLSHRLQQLKGEDISPGNKQLLRNR